MVDNINDITRASLLYDFYGGLLTDKQRSVMALYHEENLSLSEIAEEYGISRQAVHDTLKKAEQALTDYENKLNLVDKLIKTDNAVAKLKDELAALEEVAASDDRAKKHLDNARRIIESLEE